MNMRDLKSSENTRLRHTAVSMWQYKRFDINESILMSNASI